MYNQNRCPTARLYLSLMVVKIERLNCELDCKNYRQESTNRHFALRS